MSDIDNWEYKLVGELKIGDTTRYGQVYHITKGNFYYGLRFNINGGKAFKNLSSLTSIEVKVKI